MVPISEALFTIIDCTQNRIELTRFTTLHMELHDCKLHGCPLNSEEPFLGAQNSAKRLVVSRGHVCYAEFDEFIDAFSFWTQLRTRLGVPRIVI